MGEPSSSWYNSMAVSTLGSGNLREALKLPPGEDKNEWLAVNSELSSSWNENTNSMRKKHFSD